MPSSQPCRVLLAESDRDIRAALQLVLEQMPQFTLVGNSENVDELLRDSTLLQPEVILVDLELRGLHFAALEQVSSGAATIALSTHDERRRLALEAGAAAFVCKGESPLKLLETLDAILEVRPTSQSRAMSQSAELLRTDCA